MTATFSGSRVTQFTQTPRPDGYDLVVAFAFDRADGSSQEWRWTGRYVTQEQGIEWVADLAVSGTTAGTLTTRQLPRRIHTKIDYSEPHGDMRGGRVEITTTYQDGREDRRVESRLFPANPREVRAEDMLDTFRQIFERQPLLGLWRGEQPNQQ